MHVVGWLLGVYPSPAGTPASYQFWSGIVPSIAIITLPAGFLRKHNCEVHGCWRLGRHDTAAGHTVCRSHHPDDGISAEFVEEAHRNAKRRS